MKSDKTQLIELPSEISAEWIAAQNVFLKKHDGREIQVNCGQLQRLDSLSLAWLLHLQTGLEKRGGKLLLSQIPPHLQNEFQNATYPEKLIPEAPETSFLLRWGEGALAIWEEAHTLLYLLSESLYWSTLGVLRRKTILPGETARQMFRLGSSALPIVLLLSALIGLTLSIQSGMQLEKYGAAIFLAGGIGISMLTEIGPVLTAVILAGRSGSSITAEISTMVVQEELSALHTMAIRPIHFLLLPRFWAMSLALPLLTVCSVLIGIGSGMVVGVLVFKLSVPSFLNELKNNIELRYVFQCLIKSLTFSWVITLVAVSKGLQVRGGADAVGKATTSCVVTCIFLIIFADAIFSFIFYF